MWKSARQQREALGTLRVPFTTAHVRSLPHCFWRRFLSLCIVQKFGLFSIVECHPGTRAILIILKRTLPQQPRQAAELALVEVGECSRQAAAARRLLLLRLSVAGRQPLHSWLCAAGRQNLQTWLP